MLNLFAKDNVHNEPNACFVVMLFRVLCLYFIVSLNYCADVESIVVLDYMKIRKQSVIGKSMDAQIKDMMDKISKQMTALQDKIKEEHSSNAKKKVSSREDYSESVENYSRKLDALVKLSRKLRVKTRQIIDAAELKFREILAKVIETKYDALQSYFVFEKSQLLFFKSVKEITDEVLQLLDETKETITITIEEINVGL